MFAALFDKRAHSGGFLQRIQAPPHFKAFVRILLSINSRAKIESA
jgi:hypothetical protein